MPLRFDQPELLGKWEGDSAPLHQAIAKIGKGESVLERGLEKKNPKTPSYKIDPVKGSPFKKDNDKIGKLVAQAVESVGRGEDPIQYTTKAEQITNTGLAQKNALDQIKLQLNEIQQTYPDGVVNPIPVNDNINSAYNDHDDETRDQAISEAANNLKDPSVRMINSDRFYANKLLKMAPVTVDYTEKDEFGNVNVGTERKVSGRLLVPDIKRPQFEGKNGKKVPAVDANGQPIYQLRPAETVDDVIPLVQAAFREDPIMAQWKVNQVSREEKKTIDDITNEWISSERNRPDGGIPDKETIEAKRQIIARDLAEKKIAKQWLQSERPTTVLNNTRTVDKPTEADIAKSQNRENLRKSGGSTTRVGNTVFTNGADERKYYSTSSGGNLDFSTKGAISVQQQEKNGTFKPIPYLSQSIQGDVWDLTNGGKTGIGGNEHIQVDEFVPFVEIQNKNGQWIRRDILPSEDMSTVVKSSTIPVRVVTAAVGKVVPKGNKAMTLTDDQTALLEKLKASKFDDLSPEEKDTFGELSAIQKGEGNTIMFDAIKSNTLKKVTGYDNMNDIYNDKNTSQNIKNRAKVHIDLERRANETNTKNGFDKAKIDQQTNRGEGYATSQKRGAELYKQYEKIEDPKEKVVFMKANGVPFVNGKWDFNKATGKPSIAKPNTPTGTNAVGLTKGGKGLSDKEVEANKKRKPLGDFQIK